jgi:hypothetical protein
MRERMNNELSAYAENWIGKERWNWEGFDLNYFFVWSKWAKSKIFKLYFVK